MKKSKELALATVENRHLAEQVRDLTARLEAAVKDKKHAKEEARRHAEARERQKLASSRSASGRIQARLLALRDDEGARRELDERCGSHLERGCLMEAAVVAAVTTKCRGEWRERVVDCADAREKRARAKVCGVECCV